MDKINRKNRVMIFVDGNYIYKCIEEKNKVLSTESKRINLQARDLIELLHKAFLELPGDNDLRRTYYYNSYPPLESDKSRKESVDKLIWQIENKTNLSLFRVQERIAELIRKKTPFKDILKELNITEQEFNAQKIHFESTKQMKFYEVLQYNGPKVILKKLKKHKEGDYYQKGVDIYIASDMLSLAFENGYDMAVMVSGDADFIEVIDKIQEKGKLVYLACFEEGKSFELQRICDGFVCLDKLLPEPSIKQSKNIVPALKAPTPVSVEETKTHS